VAIVRKLNEQQPRLSLRQISAELAAAGYVSHKGKGSKRPGGKTLFNSDDETKGMRRGAVAATAATVLEFRQDCSRAELGWERRVNPDSSQLVPDQTRTQAQDQIARVL
jgi:hypothetical protein